MSETLTENSRVDFLIVPDDAIMKGKSLLSSFPNQLIILDDSQELDVAFCFTMLTLHVDSGRAYLEHGNREGSRGLARVWAMGYLVEPDNGPRCRQIP